MSGTIRLFAAVAVVALAAGPSAAQPQPAPKNIPLPYPASAQLVAQLNGFERSRDRLLKMLDVLPSAEKKVVRQVIGDGIEQLLKGRKLTAIPKAGRVFVVIHDLGRIVEPEPPVAVLVPVTGYAAFRESFLTGAERKTFEKGEKGVDTLKTFATGDEVPVYLVDLKDYVALTIDKATAEVYAGKYTRAQSGTMGPELSNSFLAADVSLYLNMDVVNDAYGEQIRQFKSLIDFALSQAQMGGMLPGLGKKQMELAKLMISGVFQGVEDCRGLVLAAEFRPEGLNLRAQARFAGETASTKLLAKERPGSLPGLGQLPKGLTSYTASTFGPRIHDLMRKLTQEFAPADDDEKGAEKIDALLAELAAAGPQAEYTANGGADSGLTVMSFANPANGLATTLKLYKALPAGARIHNIVLKTAPKVEEKARTHRGFTFAEVRTQFDFEATVKDLPENLREGTLAQFKRLAKEKMTYWIGTDGKVLAQLTAADWDAAQKLLDSYLAGNDGIGGSDAYKLTRKHLPANASLISLFETGQTLAMLVEQFRAMAKALPGGLPPIGEVTPPKGDPTFIGIAVTLRPELATVDLFVPGTSMNAAVKMLAPLFRNFE